MNRVDAIRVMGAGLGATRRPTTIVSSPTNRPPGLPPSTLIGSLTSVESGRMVMALQAMQRFAGAHDVSTETPKVYPPQVQAFEAAFAKRIGVPGATLDPFQKEAMTHLVKGDSVMVAAPTSSGKTLVANFAIESVLQRRNTNANDNSRIFYTTPRKAISGEKFRDFCKEYGPENVGLMTGDITHNPDAPIILMTTEVLRNILYEEPQKLKDVNHVVFDECHFVNDQERGPVWEECMIHMPDRVQQLHLSATVGNADQYVAWMNTISGKKTHLVYEDKRPVPLEYLFYDIGQNRIDKVFDEQGRPTRAFFTAFKHPSEYEPKKLVKALENYGLQQQQQAGKGATVDAPPSLLPAIVTSFSKKHCADKFELATSGKHVKPLLNPDKANPDQIRMRDIIAQHEHLVDPYLVKLNYPLYTGLKQGYATHHAGMTYAERSVVEQGVKAGLLKCVWATDTLGAGINVPARTAVIAQFKKYNKFSDSMEFITPSDFHQIVGRAGRRGMFDKGYAVLVPQRGLDIEDAKSIVGLMKSGPEHILSKFQATPTMVLNLLKTHTPAQARDVMSKSFAAFQAAQNKSKERVTGMLKQFDATLSFLKEQGLVEISADQRQAKLTPFGYDLSHVPDPAFKAAFIMMKGLRQWEDQVAKERSLALSQLFQTDADTAQAFAYQFHYQETQPVRAQQDLASDPSLRQKLFAFNSQVAQRAASALPQEARAFAELTSLSASELAALFSATINEKGNQEYNPRAFSPAMDKVVGAYQEASDALSSKLSAAEIGNQNPLNFSLSHFVAEWAKNGDWPSIHGELKMARQMDTKSPDVGEFMNVVRRTANLLTKLSEMQTLPPAFRSKLAESSNRLLQPPIRENIHGLPFEAPAPVAEAKAD